MKKIGKIILLCLVGFAVIGTFYFLWKKSRPVKTEYEIVTPSIGDVETKTVATGKVEPRDEVLIKPQMSGIISELMKEAGQMVREGEIIARIKVIPEMVQLNTAESRIRVAEINLQQIRSSYERDEQLYQQGVVAREDYELSLATYKKAKEELENAIDNLDIIRDGITKKSAATSNTQVRATITGMILDVPVKVGNSVIESNTFNDGTTIASVADMNNMLFVGKVDETEVGRIHEGMPLKLTVGALDGQQFDAVLEYVSPKGVEENGAIMFEIKAAVQIPEDVFIRAGYSANGEIVLKEARNVLTVPENCIEFSNDSAFVHILTQELPEQTFERHHVEVGLSDGIKIQITEGLDEESKIRGSVITPGK
ncbi:MAG: efflux RND transporter periplasmic adaptor subunit [Tannerellaceae bacterium]|nr:efflux RND transporter periplasmic adaptor subunit [Tannerellaceae bacterium]